MRGPKQIDHVKIKKYNDFLHLARMEKTRSPLRKIDCLSFLASSSCSPSFSPAPLGASPPCLRPIAPRARREMPIDSFLPLAPGAAAAVPGNYSPLWQEGR